MDLATQEQFRLKIEALLAELKAALAAGQDATAPVQLDTSIGRIEDGNYGQCRRCQQPIAHERLEAQPDAMLCVNCAGANPGR